MKNIFLIVLICCLCLNSCNSPNKKIPGTDISFHDLLMPVPGTAILTDDDFFIWGGSMIQTEDGKCHLFYSRWPRENGFNAWVSHSEIAYAISDSPLGPYTHVKVALPARGLEYWDGVMTHNPTIHKFGDKYYLYYVGNIGDRKVTPRLNHIHRNSQRIGVAVADHPSGPWQRFETPLIDVSPEITASDALMVTNPAVAKSPDGSFVMVYKAAAIDSTLEHLGGRVVHRVATSSSPVGPFKKYPGLVFDARESRFPAEDPFIWFQDERFMAILKDMHGAFTSFGKSLVLFESFNGIDWKLCPEPLASKIEINWAGKSTEKVSRLERPQIFIENGKPRVLFVAVQFENGHSGNIHIPLSVDY